MTSKEFILQHKAYEKGMIQAWVHLRFICNSCIKAHREELRPERIKKLVKMNEDRFSK